MKKIYIYFKFRLKKKGIWMKLPHNKIQNFTISLKKKDQI